VAEEYRQVMLEMFWEPTQPRLEESNLHPIAYTHDPDLKEVLVPRQAGGEEKLWPIQVDTAILPRFEDGSTLTSLYIYGTQRHDKNLHFRSRKIDKQLGFLDKDAYEKFTKKRKLATDPFDEKTLKKMRDTFPLMKLDHALSRHFILPRTFESKIHYYDVEVRMAKHTLEENGKVNFPKNDEYRQAMAAVGPVIEGAVTEKKGDRTRMLLDDLRQQLDNLEGTEIWLLAKIPPDQHGRIVGDHASVLMAVQLVGFSIHGTGDEASIEPVVRGVDGQEGLLPESVSIYPSIHLRIHSDMVREQKGILAAIKHSIMAA
jgi:hypothetical protein